MDTSKKYIKMCDCPEIQEYRKKPKSFQVGDFMANYYLGEKSKAILDEVLVFEITHHIKNRMLVVWLPRQDQIQEMLPENNCKCSCCLIFHLNKFVEDNIDGFADGGIDSIEQYWLAFLMWENYQKVWDSKQEKWVKSGKE